MKDNQPRSGAGTNQVVQPKWPLYNDLLFLLPTLKILTGCDSLDPEKSETPDAAESEEEDSVIDSASTTTMMSESSKSSKRPASTLVCEVCVRCTCSYQNYVLLIDVDGIYLSITGGTQEKKESGLRFEKKGTRSFTST